MNSTKEYDNLIGEKVVRRSPLSGLAQKTENKEWKKHWKEMPEFEQEDNAPFKTLYVHFRNEQDYEEFAKLLSQKITKQTKSIWYPKLDITKNSLLRWIEKE